MALDVTISVHLGHTYIAAHIHVVCALGIGPDHSIRRKHVSHAWGLPGEDNSAIWRGGCQERPRNRRGVAHNLRAFDEILEGLSGLQARQGREAVRRYQMNMGKLSC